jgi:CYTH domain-containing protein
MNEAAPVGKELKYAHRELERRWLLHTPPEGPIVKSARISDRYIQGTRIRLRSTTETSTDGRTERTFFKLTQKVPAPSGGPGLITSMYLTADEHAVLEQLPAALLRKTRLSIPPLGVDIFEGELDGLVIAEAEFSENSAMARFVSPPTAVAEVTDDPCFTGGRLVAMTRSELARALSSYGIASAI